MNTKKTTPKLNLRAHSIRNLTTAELRGVVGGWSMCRPGSHNPNSTKR